NATSIRQSTSFCWRGLRPPSSVTAAFLRKAAVPFTGFVKLLIVKNYSANPSEFCKWRITLHDMILSFFTRGFGMRIRFASLAVLCLIGLGLASLCSASIGYVSKWGSAGIANGQFDNPSEIAVDVTGNVYVVDTNNNRIQKFRGDGVFLTAWG